MWGVEYMYAYTLMRSVWDVKVCIWCCVSPGSHGGQSHRWFSERPGDLHPISVEMAQKLDFLKADLISCFLPSAEV